MISLMVFMIIVFLKRLNLKLTISRKVVVRLSFIFVPIPMFSIAFIFFFLADGF